MRIYLDTSVLVAYYLPENISSLVQEFLLENPVPVISEFTHLEFYSALGIRVRTNTLSSNNAQKVLALLERHLRSGYYFQDTINSQHYQKARDIMALLKLPIKAPDALHLSFALLGSYNLITADQQLVENAKKVGVTVRLLS